MTSYAWIERAACAGRDTNIWYPDAEADPRTREHAERSAKAICRGCPVRVECANYGRDEGHGIFGGLTSRERARLRPPNPPTVHATPDLPPGFTWATGTVRRLRALATMGYTATAVANKIGARDNALSGIRGGKQLTVRHTLAVAVADLYATAVRTRHHLEGQPADGIRARAAELGWQGPEAWTADTIDVPDMNAVTAYVGRGKPRDVDESIVDALVAGRRVKATAEERWLAAERLISQGMNHVDAAARMRCNARTIQRLLADHRDKDAAA